MKELYHLTNVHFSPEPDNDEMRLLKIRNGFLVSQDEAERILIKMVGKETIVILLDEDVSPHTYGINYSADSDENVQRRNKKDTENKERLAREDVIYERGLIWFETLTEEQKMMVMLLGHRKFPVFATG